MKDLLEAGVHFGHQTRRWNPKMRRYIFGKRNGIYIIDLQKTLRMFREAADFVYHLGAQGGKLLFVGTKRQAQDAVAEEAQRCGQYWMTHRWLGGTLTNWVTIRNSVQRLQEVEQRLDEENTLLTKKDLLRLDRERIRMHRNLEGIRLLDSRPDALFVVDPKREAIAVSEANKLGIPVIAIVDTNCDPEEIEFVIPGNDDAIRTIRLFSSRIGDAYLAGAGRHQEERAMKEKEASAAETTRPVEPRVVKPRPSAPAPAPAEDASAKAAEPKAEVPEPKAEASEPKAEVPEPKESEAE
ncbi:MAG TPA: 30S ribosomal protein S2, partial [Vicinamibacterales bacterium]|nr:30S ribosomal protein S2 [Vicinamibacterales bacterium]